MTNSDIFFCDTYALVEIARGSTAYRKYLDATLITADLNVMEMYYSFLRNVGREKATEHYAEWIDISIAFPRKIIIAAMEFKLQNHKEKLSYIDCLGYAFSLDNGIKFLTGDEKFEVKPNVEFVK